MKEILLMEKGKEKENFIQIKISMFWLNIKMEKQKKKMENIPYFIKMEHSIKIQIIIF